LKKVHLQSSQPRRRIIRRKSSQPNPKEAFEEGIISSREGHSDGNVYERRRRKSARGGGCDQ
jgi:hypothetical protein